jgi:hypothetical protein
MLQKSWIKLFIGLVVFSTFVGGCAKTGPTVSGPKPTVQSENEYDPARGLDPNSPSFWLDYQSIYGPK